MKAVFSWFIRYALGGDDYVVADNSLQWQRIRYSTASNQLGSSVETMAAGPLCRCGSLQMTAAFGRLAVKPTAACAGSDNPRPHPVGRA